jgi:two-component system sensor histidine kinase CpxA
MRSLFFKIFLWFWLIVVLVGVTLEVSVFMIHRQEQRWFDQVRRVLPVESKKAAAIFEASGAGGLEAYFDQWERRDSIRGYLFDENRKPILDRVPPAAVLELAGETEPGNTPALAGRKGLAAEEVTGPGGRRYIMAVQFLRPPISRFWIIFADSAILRVLTILLLGGALCLGLARHLTRPLLQVQEAAGRIAEGRLETRVGTIGGGRGDEIAMLGRNFDRMAERIEALVVSHRSLLADVSHEIRSPLARLMLALGLLRRSAPEETSELEERIGIEAKRIDRIVGQLLTLSRIDSGVGAGPREAFDLTNLVHEVAADGDFECRHQEKTVKVRLADSCTMFGNLESVRTAIENVVRNAIRYAPPHTGVEITLQKNGAQQPAALLRIRDHGPGVPEEMLSRIFLRFQRVPVVSGPEPQGAGLGLAITDRIVRIHEGRIRASNADGGGLIVEIEFPLQRQGDAKTDRTDVSETDYR